VKLDVKILFVCSGNYRSNSIGQGISPILRSQRGSLEKCGVSVEYYPITGRGLLNYIVHIPKLKSVLKNGPYDVVHAHYGLCGIVCLLARNKEKLVVSFMGDDLIGSVNNKGKYSLLGDIIVSINKFISKRFDYVVLKSDELAKIIDYKYRAVIPNGVDLDNFYEVNKKEARKVLGIDERKKIILFISNPARAEKNYKLAEMSVDALDDKNIQLIAVHSIEQELLKYYYSAADLLLLTSYHEGSPNVIKEAMACNCPIVSTDVGDVSWIIGETKGCFITSFEIEDVAEKIKMALDYSTVKGRTNGRVRIIELGVDSNSVAKRIINIYEKLITK
jgi:teichuronic acid biosynthesis glycosyltransferase TuaC